ncbi:amino acid:polyamine antiporter [Micromonospora echinofusca]|uniref:Amino acid:polyamine antiporter n=1 Tax=Micromonospora echinofusca TaxID=47858 RepID=A0ABS3VT06_MICEH|nr:amino acid:polyamine antiporter [Micromonospora echinofusca]
MAAGVSGGVLGAGMLIMPPVVAALAGGHSLLVWSAHLLLGASVSLMLAMSVHARVGPTSLAGAVGALLAPWAQRAVDGVFAVAFTAGQAAIAWFAATCLLAAAHGALPRPGTDGLLLALAVLAVAVLAALSPFSLPAVALRLRPWVTGLLALACVAWGWPAVPAAGADTPLAPSDLSPAGGQWLALAALFFAGVGWEAVTTVVPVAAASRRRTAAGVVLGAVAVAVVYLGLAAVQRVTAGAPATGDSVPTPLRWVLTGAVVTVLTSYCFTNVRTAARIVGRLRPGDEPRPTARGATLPVIAAVGAACCAFAVLGTRDGAVPLLLLGPAAAALTGYGLAAAGAVRRGGPLLRVTGVAVLLVLAGMTVLSVPLLRGG